MRNILILGLIVIPLLSYSQFDNLKVSILTGPSFGRIGTDNNKISSKGINLGYKLHIQGEYLLNDRFSITIGLGLSLSQGGSLVFDQGGHLWSESKLSISKPDSLPNGVKLGYNINYLEFPIGFKMRTNSFGKFRFYAQMPEFSTGIRTKAKGSIIGTDVKSSKEQIKKEIQFLNLSWALGLGTEYSVSEKLDLIFGVRFFQSITDITDDSGRYFDNSKENSKGILNSLDLRFGVLF